MKKIIFLSIIIAFSMLSCKNSNQNVIGLETKDTTEFSIAFLTDIHLEPERHAVEGFKQAIDTVNKLNPDFVITGGDLVFDVLEQGYGRADTLFNLYKKTCERFNMPVYNTIGNHENFGLFKNSGVDTANPEFFYHMYEHRIGKRYYAFNYKGWRFYSLDAIDKTPQRNYFGNIDNEQIEWLKNDLKSVDSAIPIAIIVHIPLITTFTQIYSGSLATSDSGLVVVNSKEVLSLFEHHNLKLVLQGHLHTVEDIYVNGTHFITGGAVCAAWWTGPNKGFQEGFMMLKLNKDGLVKWNYVDYGWEIKH